MDKHLKNYFGEPSQEKENISQSFHYSGMEKEHLSGVTILLYVIAVVIIFVGFFVGAYIDALGISIISSFIVSAIFVFLGENIKLLNRINNNLEELNKRSYKN